MRFRSGLLKLKTQSIIQNILKMHHNFLFIFYICLFPQYLHVNYKFIYSFFIILHNLRHSQNAGFQLTVSPFYHILIFRNYAEFVK